MKCALEKGLINLGPQNIETWVMLVLCSDMLYKSWVPFIYIT